MGTIVPFRTFRKCHCLVISALVGVAVMAAPCAALAQTTGRTLQDDRKSIRLPIGVPNNPVPSATQASVAKRKDFTKSLTRGVNTKRVPESKYPKPVSEEPPPLIIALPPATIDQCTDAELRLTEIEQSVAYGLKTSTLAVGDPSRFSSLWLPLTPPKRQDLERYSTALERYMKTCVARSDGVTAAYRALGMDRISGILQQDSGSQWLTFCSAFRLTTSRIATARHCFYRMYGYNDAPPAQALIESGRVAFVLPMNSTTRYIVKAETCSPAILGSTDQCKQLREGVKRGYVTFGDDYIVLEIDTSAVPMPQLALEPPTDNLKYVTMMTWLMYPEFLGKAAAALGRQTDFPVATELFLPRAGTCPIAGITNKACILDGCQSSRGSSGSALFVADEKRLRLLGIHLAAADGSASPYLLDQQCEIARARTLGGAVLGSVAHSVVPALEPFLQ